MTSPLVSIIVPAYNAERWLSVTVGSILAQTFTNWELIIVNDGSTDRTLEVAQGFHDSRIRVVDQANAGVSAARNKGFSVARGEFLTLLDSDDTKAPDSLEVMLECIQGTGTDWTFGDLVVCDGDMNPTGGILKGAEGDVLRLLLLNLDPPVPGAGSNIMFRRRCYEEGVRFDTRLSNAADQDFTMQLAAIYNYRYAPGAVSYYRVLPGSMSKNIERHERDHRILFRNAEERGLLQPALFRRKCLANVHWAFGGSWWLLAGRRAKAIPYFLHAMFLWPPVIIRPIRKRLIPAPH